MYMVTTVITVATLFYTADFYFRIYRATHALNIEVQGFDVSILNTTHALTETRLTIQNPSEFEFEVVYVEERLSSNPSASGSSSFILHGLAWFRDPKPIQPASSITVTINETVHVEKIQTAPRIFATITVFLRGPLIGEFLMQSYETLR